MPFTQFVSSINGFHFSNRDITWSAAFIHGKALCGGMAYAAIDYFVSGMTIPQDGAAPPEGTPLHNYIYHRQNDAHINTGNKFAGLWIPTPLISNLLTGFSMDADAELAKLVGALNTGRPIPICLVGGFADGHHLVAMGCNPTPPITITAYDPNEPDKTAMVQEFTPAGASTKKFVNSQAPGKVWEYFFVDTSYRPVTPTVVAGQAKWRLCARCMGLYFDGHPTKGACPAGGAHGGLSANYWLDHGTGTGQGNWRHCRVCEGLFFLGGGIGVCPKNPNGHDASQSGEYFLSQGPVAGRQERWAWCRVCQGLFFAGTGSLGVCPKNPNGHDATQSGNYSIAVTTG